MTNEYKHKDLTEKIIGAAFKVHKALGWGFLEKVYQNALMIELAELNVKSEAESPVKVYYEEKLVGDFIADLLVEDKVIIELKAVKELNEAHEVQLVNYLKATGIEVGLLINFGEKVVVKRRIYSDADKGG